MSEDDSGLGLKVHEDAYRELERERDEALSDLEFRRDLFKLQEQQLNDVRAERDRLAEALRELCETFLADKPRDITDLLNKAGAALAAVKGGKP